MLGKYFLEFTPPPPSKNFAFCITSARGEGGVIFKRGGLYLKKIHTPVL